MYQGVAKLVGEEGADQGRDGTEQDALWRRTMQARGGECTDQAAERDAGEQGKMAVRLGVEGSLSPMYSPKASTAKMRAEMPCPDQAAQVPATARLPRQAKKHITAMGVMERAPVRKPRAGMARSQEAMGIMVKGSLARCVGWEAWMGASGLIVRQSVTEMFERGKS